MKNRISQIAGLLVILIAIIVLLGWQFNLSLLKSGFPGISATMKVNAALCFIFAGVSLILSSHPRNYPTTLSSLSTVSRSDHYYRFTNPE